MSFERSYCTESHEKIKQILIFGDKSLLLTCWVTNTFSGSTEYFRKISWKFSGKYFSGKATSLDSSCENELSFLEIQIMIPWVYIQNSFDDLTKNQPLPASKTPVTEFTWPLRKQPLLFIHGNKLHK